MSLDKMQQLVSSLVKSVEDNEKVVVGVLAAKLAKCVDAYPEDKTIGGMHRVISKMADNNAIFISRAQLKELYNKLYTRNTKFADLFQEELHIDANLETAKAPQHDDSVEVKPYEVQDQILANALGSVFDKTLPVKMYSQVAANRAQKYVLSSLESWNLHPNDLTVDSGNDKFIVIKADYDTPKGITSFYVPLQIEGNTVIEASIFMGNSGPQELNHVALKEYLTKNAGNKLKITGSGILHVLTEAISNKRELTDTEVALTKLNAIRQGKSEFFQDSIVGQELTKEVEKDVELPRYEEALTFEKKFASEVGQAVFQFGEEAVKNGRNHIVRELNGFGNKNPQVVVGKSDKTTIYYHVALDGGRVGFTVPVKVNGEKINKPAFILANGVVSEFSQAGINKLYQENAGDYRAAAIASPQFELKSSDLLDNIRAALSENNLVKAEDALNVLYAQGDAKTYALGFNLYMDGLSGIKKEAAVECGCSMTIKNASSQHLICGHTGLPINKIYQDKDGNCRPLYRRGMEETYDGATFINAKIFG